MSNDLQARRLRAAFETMSEPIRPPAGLADRVRRHERRRRRALFTSAAAATVAVAVVMATLVAGRLPGRGGPDLGPTRLDIPVANGTTELAADARYLYIASGDVPDSVLRVYDRPTGRFVRSVRVPALAAGLAVGPGGTVWLSFQPDQNGGQVGLWLLSPDLRQRASVSSRTAALIDLAHVLPTGTTTALTTASGWLDELRLPVPGGGGQAILRRISRLAAGPGYVPAGLAPLGNQIAVLESNGIGHSRITIAGVGRPGYSLSGVSVAGMAAQAGGLWLAAAPGASGPLTGGLLRLGPRLKLRTPRNVAAAADLRFPAAIWTSGETVWVTTTSPSRSLFCFRYTAAGGAGPVTSVPTSPAPDFVAAAAGQVYLGGALGVTSSPVPQACR